MNPGSAIIEDYPNDSVIISVTYSPMGSSVTKMPVEQYAAHNCAVHPPVTWGLIIYLFIYFYFFQQPFISRKLPYVI
jgi:hypothetical protein